MSSCSLNHLRVFADRFVSVSPPAALHIIEYPATKCSAPRRQRAWLSVRLDSFLGFCLIHGSRQAGMVLVFARSLVSFRLISYAIVFFFYNKSVSVGFISLEINQQTDYLQLQQWPGGCCLLLLLPQSLEKNASINFIINLMMFIWHKNVSNVCIDSSRTYNCLTHRKRELYYFRTEGVLLSFFCCYFF